jgi:hypothetical protein
LNRRVEVLQCVSGVASNTGQRRSKPTNLDASATYIHTRECPNCVESTWPTLVWGKSGACQSCVHCPAVMMTLDAPHHPRPAAAVELLESAPLGATVQQHLVRLSPVGPPNCKRRTIGPSGSSTSTTRSAGRSRTRPKPTAASSSCATGPRRDGSTSRSSDAAL